MFSLKKHSVRARCIILSILQTTQFGQSFVEQCLRPQCLIPLSAVGSSHGDERSASRTRYPRSLEDTGTWPCIHPQHLHTNPPPSRSALPGCLHKADLDRRRLGPGFARGRSLKPRPAYLGAYRAPPPGPTSVDRSRCSTHVGNLVFHDSVTDLKGLLRAF